MSKQAKKLYKFGHFSVDAAERLLLRDERVVPLTPKAFDLLLVLVENRGHLVEKDALMQELWPETFVEEANLTNNVSLLRKALAGDDEQRYIETVRSRGYRFVAEIEESSGEAMGLIVEQRTRFTFEQVEEEGDAPAAADGNQLAGPLTPPSESAGVHSAPAPPAPSAFSKRTWVAVVVGSLLLVAAVAALFVWPERPRLEPQKSASLPPHMEIKRVTASGKAKNAAISPDGRYIAYVLAEGGLHSIYLMQVDTSTSLQIRPPADVAYGYLSFTPDGTSLYYSVREKGQPQTLCRSDVLGGVPQKVLTGIDSPFTFSPDGKRLAFVRFYPEEETAVVVADAQDGTGEQKLAMRKSPERFSVNGPSWSPDGQMIAVSATNGANSARAKIFGVRAADGKVEPLSDYQWSDVDRMAWLGDGSGLVLIAGHQELGDRRQIWHLSCPGGEVTRITNDLHEYEGNNLSVSADSRSLVTVQIQTTSNIWVLPDGELGRARQLTFGQAGKYDGFYGLSWTPDGKIVYGSYVGNRQTIWVMDADGGNQKQLTASGQGEKAPNVTADGRHIVFRSNRTGALEIWRMDIDGGNPVPLTEGGNNFQPSVSPDGKWVVYRSSRDGMWALWKVSIDGGDPARLTDKPAGWPAVSPDGKLIACMYDGHIALIPFAGGSPVKTFPVPRTATAYQGLRWTPDGQALILRDTVHGIWLQPLAGGEAKHLTNLGPETIFNLAWSPDGKQLALARGTQSFDVVLIRLFR